jgi:hypothetical protein
MIPMVLGELYLHLPMVREVLVAIKKGRGIGELLEKKKSIAVPNMTVLWG